MTDAELELYNARAPDQVVRAARACLDSCESTTMALKALGEVLGDYGDDEGSELLKQLAERFCRYEATQL